MMKNRISYKEPVPPQVLESELDAKLIKVFNPNGGITMEGCDDCKKLRKSLDELLKRYDNLYNVVHRVCFDVASSVREIRHELFKEKQ